MNLKIISSLDVLQFMFHYNIIKIHENRKIKREEGGYLTLHCCCFLHTSSSFFSFEDNNLQQKIYTQIKEDKHEQNKNKNIYKNEEL